MSLENTIFTIRKKISCDEIRNENDVTALIVNPLLEGLGWPTANKNLVAYEYRIDGKRVDLALSRRKGKEEVFIEVKRIGAQSKAIAEDQLFGYLSRKGVPVAVLAYGYQWSFYHPYGPGEYKDRKILEINLLRNPVQECVRVLHRYLDRKSVCSGTAADNVRADAENIFAHKEEKETFGKALNCLVEKRIPFSKIRLSQEFEDICGHLPASRDLDEFIERGGLPLNCPITPLGTGNDGKELYVMNAQGYFNKIKSGSLNQKIYCLYSPLIEQMTEDFPCETVMDTLEDAKKAAGKAIRNACWMRGEFDLNDVRGLGAWPGDNSELILHAGEEITVFDSSAETGKVFDNGKVFRPGKIGKYIYPRDSRGSEYGAKPAKNHQNNAVENGPGAELLEILKSRNWMRPSIDSHLFMGLIGCAMVSGALAKRPLVWITGPCIDETNEYVLPRVFRPGKMHACSASIINEVKAAIWDQPTLVVVDSLNSHAKKRDKKAVRQLLQEVMLGKKYDLFRPDPLRSAQSCYLFSSTDDSPLVPTDFSNFVVLKQNYSARSEKPNSDLGPRIFRRMVDGWPRYEETLNLFRNAFAEEGHNAGMAEQYGALLSAASLIMEDCLPSQDDAQKLTNQLAPQPGAGKPKAPIDKTRPAQVLSEILGFHHRSEQACVADLARVGANEKLGSCGMRVVSQNGENYLAVANNHPALKAQFADTSWSKTLGNRTAWSIELGRLPGALKSGNAIRFDKYSNPSRAVLVPLTLLFEYTAVSCL